MLWSGIILFGSVAYMVLNSDNKTKEVKEVKEVKEEIKSNYDKTFLYFSNLSLDQQYKYMEQNLDLKDYKDILTDNKYFNAKKVANISEKLNKEFTNINKVY